MGLEHAQVCTPLNEDQHRQFLLYEYILCVYILSGLCWGARKLRADSLASTEPTAGTVTMEKGDIVRTICERMLVDDTVADVTAGSRTRGLRIRCGSEEERASEMKDPMYL